MRKFFSFIFVKSSELGNLPDLMLKMSLTQLNTHRDYDLINKLEDSLASLQVLINLLEANSGPIVILHTLKLEVRRTYNMLKQMKQKRRPITIDSNQLMDWS